MDKFRCLMYVVRARLILAPLSDRTMQFSSANEKVRERFYSSLLSNISRMWTNRVMASMLHYEVGKWRINIVVC